jgi:acetolactate synthase-1/2/3 large subunit
MSEIKVSDLIAEFLETKKVKYIFGIVGAGNAHLFDSIYKHGYTKIICVHHEQAATMAMQTYYRISGEIGACLVTTGAGSTNAVTGVMSAWADSLPGLIIAGNENSAHTRVENPLRMWGVQGYDSVHMVEKITKYSKRVVSPTEAIYELDKAADISLSGRPGPVWIEIPMDVQSKNVKLSEVKKYSKEIGGSIDINNEVKEVVKLIKEAKRPVFWFGNGIRLSNAEHLIENLFATFKIPALVSWAGKDMVAFNHPLNFGSAGVYGQRAANFVLQNSDLIISIGTRLALPQIGYDTKELARGAKLVVNDIDKKEIDKLQDRLALGINADAKIFIENLIQETKSSGLRTNFDLWIKDCNDWKTKFPLIGPEHEDQKPFINSYKFIDRLSQVLKDDQIIVTDMGTALLSGHQNLKLKKGQRLMTSTGLGEMGFGLPAAIGASFARNKSEVICLNCDGGIMMNLQELQTIVHHKLPIKIFIFNNDGYLMIKHTQKSLFKGRYSGTDNESGVSCPDFKAVAKSFNLPSFQIRSWSDFDEYIPLIMKMNEALVCEIFMHPEQFFYPKLALSVQKDGSLISPALEDLSPFLSRKELKENMKYVSIHPKSEKIDV